MKWLVGLGALLAAGRARAAAPEVSNVSAAQIPESKAIRITYDLEATGPCAVSVLISDSPGRFFSIVPKALTGDVGDGIVPGTDKEILWDALADLPLMAGSGFCARVIASTGGYGVPPDSHTMVTIPAGTFAMGDTFNEGETYERPSNDWFSATWYAQPGATVPNSRGPETGTLRMLRGGSWSGVTYYLRCANRSLVGEPGGVCHVRGFRCAGEGERTKRTKRRAEPLEPGGRAEMTLNLSRGWIYIGDRFVEDLFEVESCLGGEILFECPDTKEYVPAFRAQRLRKHCPTESETGATQPKEYV